MCTTQGAEQAFPFSKELVDAVLVVTTELLLCESWGKIFLLSPQTGSAVLSLSITDSNKEMLLSDKLFLPCTSSTQSELYTYCVLYD